MLKNDTWTIKELLDRFQDERIKLPELQRNLVWNRQQMRKLVDSIYKNYPTGSILLWETDEEIETKTTAISLKKKAKFREQYQLLDGQQRLTSLLACLRGEKIRYKKGNEEEEKIVEIFFDLEHPETVKFGGDYDEDEDEDEITKETDWFQTKTRKIEKKEQWISILKLRNDKKYSLKLAEYISEKHGRPGTEKFALYSERISKIQKLDENYEIPVVILTKDMSYAQVADIFVRVNSGGRKLRSSDLALAQITVKWRGSVKIFEDFSDKIGEDKFGIQANDLIRILVAIATDQGRFDSVQTISKKNLMKSWDKTKDSLQNTINFLKSAKIEQLDIIPSINLILFLAYIINKEKNELGKRHKLLLKWFFTAAMWARYSGSTEQTIDFDLSIIKNNKEDYIKKMIGEIKNLRGGKLDVFENDLEGVDQRSPLFFMLYVIIRQNGAKDWRTGNEVSLVNSGNKYSNEVDHIFPQKKLETFLKKKYKKKSEVKKLVNDIGNLAFLSKVSNIQKSDKLPEKYFPEQIKKYGKEILTKQCIPIEKNLWKLENYEKFISKRRKIIANQINEYMKSLG